MKGQEPDYNSGKTRFTRLRGEGKSWCDRREVAIKAEEWRRPQPRRHEEKKT